MSVTATVRRLMPAAAVALCALATSTSPAQAGVLVQSAGTCPAQPLSQPFLRWVDPLLYTAAPNGSVEAGTQGWTLSGARVVRGNEPYYVTAKSDVSALELPPGSRAQTSAMCVGLDHLTLRFFARSSAPLLSTLTSALQVEVLFETSTGQVLSAPVGLVALSPTWAPTLPMPVVANLLPLLPNSRTPVAFRFTPVGGATWRIDDLYVDPKMRT